jgi:hypothetical protein
MPADTLQTSDVSDLKESRRAFDAARRELGIGLSGLDVPKREQIVKCAMRLAHANDPQPDEQA